MKGEFIYPESHIYASVNQAIIGQDNALLPVQQQAINGIKSGLLLIVPLGITFQSK